MSVTAAERQALREARDRAVRQRTHAVDQLVPGVLAELWARDQPTDGLCVFCGWPCGENRACHAHSDLLNAERKLTGEAA